MLLITPAQCRAARALLNWSQPELAERCGMHVQTISAFEGNVGSPTKRTLERVFYTLDAAGVEFMPQDGVRNKVQGVVTYLGRDGYDAFTWDVASTVEMMGGNLCVSNVREEWFSSARSPKVDVAYRKKMTEIQKRNNFNFRILVQEGDTNFIASAYAHYRWLDKRYFQTVPFYVYGDKLAIIHFQKGPLVHVVQNMDMADAQRSQFDILWETAKIPPEI